MIGTRISVRKQQESRLTRRLRRATLRLFARPGTAQRCVTTARNYNAGGRVIFEWDERKRCDNYRKHGLDFSDCAKVFAGVCVTVPDNRFAYGEPRLWAYGMLEERVVVVVYTERDDVIRVISMRKASRREEAQYFENL
jgi:uncharacterized DUF497 family protein